MLTVYIASALFGGCVLVGSWFFDHDQMGDQDVPGSADEVALDHVPGADGHHPVGALGTLLRLRFWTFGLTFFGLGGILLHTLGNGLVRTLAPFLAALVGGGAGVVATRILGRLLSSSPGVLTGARAHVGREGRLLLPAGRGQRGKVRLQLPSGADLDLVAETQDGEELPIGTKVMVLELRDSVALVARSLTEKGKP